MQTLVETVTYDNTPVVDPASVPEYNKLFDTQVNYNLGDYFTSRDVKVRFNALGNSMDLVKLYINETQATLDAHGLTKSEYVKGVVYDQYVTMSPREKLTGFENFYGVINEMDIKMPFANNFAPAIPFPKVDTSQANDLTSYKAALGSSLRDITSPILMYLSGGVDSELVASIMVEEKIPFDVVIFKWMTADGTVGNADDIKYAFDFCTKHNIAAVIKEIDVAAWWASEEFAEKAKVTGIGSIQILTHVHMVDVMAKEMPDHMHVFGGEVRYKSDYFTLDNRSANLVTLAKNSSFFGTSAGKQGGMITNQPMDQNTSGTVFTAGTTRQSWAVGLKISNDGSWQALGINPLITSGVAEDFSVAIATLFSSTPLASGTWYTTAFDAGAGATLSASSRAHTVKVTMAPILVSGSNAGSTTLTPLSPSLWPGSSGAPRGTVYSTQSSTGDGTFYTVGTSPDSAVSTRGIYYVVNGSVYNSLTSTTGVTTTTTSGDITYSVPLTAGAANEVSGWIGGTITNISGGQLTDNGTFQLDTGGYALVFGGGTEFSVAITTPSDSGPPSVSSGIIKLYNAINCKATYSAPTITSI